MNTAICFKSESADYYMFTCDADSYQDIRDALLKQWYIKECAYVVGFHSERITDKGVIKAFHEAREILEEDE